ncbi:MAG: diguanylate cyclase [Nitrospirota bacterium]|nr:diguanylate cyclase [Nitrospirota bacterium]
MNKNRPTILVVDDSPASIEAISAILREENEVLTAGSGTEGLRLALTEHPDLILLDIIMPDIDGYKVCTELRLNSRTKFIPVIFLTARTEEEYEAKGLELGAIDYITKPVFAPIVKARVRNHLQLKQYRDMLESLSTTDCLTETANRRRFDEYLDQEWRRASRTGKPLSLIMADIDYFKNFNDNYGHIAGDACLSLFAATLADVARRAGDLFARYGGEEFACILPETPPEGALKVAERFRDAINSLSLPHAHSSVAGHVTLSFGVATIDPSREVAQGTLVDMADKMLYESKRNGRNRITQQPRE